MPSTYTLNNGIELIGTGEQSGTWGDTTNTNLELLDTALDGQVTITATSAGTSGSPNDLPISDGSASDGRNRMVIITSATDLGADVYYQLTPNDAEKIIYVRNDLNTQDLILFQGTYSASNDYVVPNGKTAVIFFDGAGTGAVAANVFNNAHFDNLNIVGDVVIGDDLSLQSDGAIINFGADDDVTLTHVADTGLTLESDSLTTFRIVSNDTTSNAAPIIDLIRDSATPADNDNIGRIRFRADNDAAEETTFVYHQAEIVDASDANEAALYDIWMQKAGSLVRRLSFTNTDTVLNNDGQDIDFRVEGSSDGHLFFADAGNNRIGISTSAPTELTHIVFDLDNSADRTTTGVDPNVAGGLKIQNDNGTTGSFAGLFLRASSGDFKIINEYTGSTNGAEANFYIDQFSGTPRLAMTMQSGGTIFNEEGGAFDFRIETDNAPNFFKVDGTNNNLEIGATYTGADVGIVQISQLSAGADNGLAIFNGADTSSRLYANNNKFYVTRGGILEAIVINEVGDVAINDTGSSTSDFRVETDNFSNGFYVDSSADRFGFYTGTPQVNIDATTTDQNIYMRLRSNNANPQDVVLQLMRGTVSTFGGDAFNDWQIKNDGGAYRLEVANSTDGTLELYEGSSANGSVFNQDGDSQLDFRIEGSTSSNLFFVDSSQNHITIGGNQTTWPVDNGLSIRADQIDLSTNTNRTTNAALTIIPAGTVDTNGWQGIFFANSTVDGYGWTIGNQRQSTSGGNALLDFRYHSNNTNGESYLRMDAAEVTVNENSFNVDFRVESNNSTDMLFVDAGLDCVNINSSRGDGVLCIEYASESNQGGFNYISTAPGSGTAPDLYMYRDSESPASEDNLACLHFVGNDSGGSPQNYASIWSGIGTTTAGAEDGRLYFGVAKDGTIPPTANSEQMTIFNNLVVLNDSSRDVDFRVEGDGDANLLVADAGTDRVIVGSNSGEEKLSVKFNSNNSSYLTTIGEDPSACGLKVTNEYTGSSGQYCALFLRAHDADVKLASVKTGSNQSDFVVIQDNTGANETMRYDMSADELILKGNGLRFDPVRQGATAAARIYMPSNGTDTLHVTNPANSTDVATFSDNGNFSITGNLSKGGGSFKIDHPLPAKNATHHLVHSFIEGPQADNLYRGKVTLAAGTATVNLDTVSSMTEGTFVLLNREVQCFTTNETGWTAVKGSVSGNTLTITAQDNTCTDTVSWLVIGERQDQFMYDNDYADENGKIIVEPLKATSDNDDAV